MVLCSNSEAHSGRASAECDIPLHAESVTRPPTWLSRRSSSTRFRMVREVPSFLAGAGLAALALRITFVLGAAVAVRASTRSARRATVAYGAA